MLRRLKNKIMSWFSSTEYDEEYLDDEYLDDEYLDDGDVYEDEGILIPYEWHDAIRIGAETQRRLDYIVEQNEELYEKAEALAARSKNHRRRR